MDKEKLTLKQEITIRIKDLKEVYGDLLVWKPEEKQLDAIYNTISTLKKLRRLIIK